MKVKITERSRITTLEFKNLKEFATWIKAQAFNPTETIEFLTEAH